MTHGDYHSSERPAGGDRRDLLVTAAVCAVLAVAGTVSFLHLADQYRKATPWREARAEGSERRAAEWRAERDAQKAAAAESRSPVAQPPETPIAAEWAVSPTWPRLTEDLFPEGVSEISVRFRCRVNAEGVLSACSGTESPGDTGLGRRMLPALNAARVKPVLIGGQPLVREIEFGVSFSKDPPPDAPPAG